MTAQHTDHRSTPSADRPFRLVVLGRDGVINETDDATVTIRSDAWKPVPGSLEAIAMLTRAAIRVVVATNQQALREEGFDIDDLHDVHEKMLRLVHENGGAIDAIFFSSVGNPRSQGKRQPKVALLEQIRSRYRVEFPDMIVIGDSREDLEAAAEVGARAVLVQTGHGQELLDNLRRYGDVDIYGDLATAVDALLPQP